MRWLRIATTIEATFTRAFLSIALPSLVGVFSPDENGLRVSTRGHTFRPPRRLLVPVA
jgi:hypothetical protein